MGLGRAELPPNTLPKGFPASPLDGSSRRGLLRNFWICPLRNQDQHPGSGTHWALSTIPHFLVGKRKD